MEEKTTKTTKKEAVKTKPAPKQTRKPKQEQAKQEKAPKKASKVVKEEKIEVKEPIVKQEPKKEIGPLSIASLTSGIIALLFAPHQLTMFTKATLPFSIATALIGLITYVEANKKNEPDNYLKLAGLVLSIVALVTAVYGFVVFRSMSLI